MKALRKMEVGKKNALNDDGSLQADWVALAGLMVYFSGAGTQYGIL